MATGIVKWFSAAKGFGFIEEAPDGADVFAHYSHIAADDLVALQAGQKVNFDLAQSPKGPYAENIHPV
ncbi:cold-shock protein [Streptomyces sp. NPDC017993]|uniref:cold-shock protein n=1 Tax=Streptomyces sp. NPDC017993 TaxID=3365027 RepID=UPI0037B484CC